MNMRYIVGYTLPYEHRVQVGIDADRAEEAIHKAQALFDEAEIWQDTEEVPLLLDEYEETGDDPLVFTIDEVRAPDTPWPEPDSSVEEVRRREAAFAAARLLVNAYDRGEENAGSIDWNDLDHAYDGCSLFTETEKHC